MEFSFSWEDINVSVTERHHTIFCKSVKRKKIILENVSGKVENNSLIAIMGPSGAGKSTFLNAISGKCINKGLLKINDKIVSNDIIKDISGFMQQEDIFTNSLTVYEHMLFMTALKLNKTKEGRIEVINRILKDLSLKSQKTTEIRFLSGGERRRLSLATELIKDPLILFCDEPTTGLDSYNAISVIKILEATALNGKIVLVSVHQPSSQLFDCFNNIILMANGNLLFQGSKESAKCFFESVNLVCPSSYNPADFYMKCLTNNYDQLSSYKNCNEDDTRMRDGSAMQLDKILDYKNSNFEKSFFYELRWLIWRMYLDTKRNLSRYYFSCTLLMISATILATSYSEVRIDAPDSVQNIQGAWAFMISELIFTNMYFVIYIFPQELSIFVREKNMYKSFPYYISKLVLMLPYCLFNTFGFLAIYFTFLQFANGVELFFNLYIVLCIMSLSAASLGLCLSAISPSLEYIDLVIVPLELLCMILSGLWIKIDSLPVLFSYIKYLSPFFMSFQSTSTLQWNNVLTLGRNCSEATNLPCFDNGKQVLESYKFLSSDDIILNNMLFMTILSAFYCIVGYLGIIRKRALYSF